MRLYTILLTPAVIFALILGLAIMGYGYFGYKAKITEIAYQKETDSANRRNYAKCLEDADNRYHSRWDSSCEAVKRDKDCVLPDNIATEYDDQLRYNKDRCAQMYKQ